jgi:anhydro-N-acetylmuramic acid kinase
LVTFLGKLTGGQGAPLVPIGDEFLFENYDACLNLGGISNISFKKNGKRIAFDISPFNLVLNYLAEKSGNKFDDKGKLAESGKINFELFNELNNLSFYQKQPPKSLGVEFCYSTIFPLIEQSKLETKDLLATFVEHFAFQIAEVLSENQLKNVLVTGGGAYNKFFIKTLKSKTSTEVILPENQIIDYKEALIFALMGLLKIENQINVFQSVTGANKNHSSGIIIE